jgi:hypothetical protein
MLHGMVAITELTRVMAASQGNNDLIVQGQQCVAQLHTETLQDGHIWYTL